MAEKEKKTEINWDDVLAEEATYFQLNGRMGRFTFLALFASWGMANSIASYFDIIGLWHLVNIACFISTIFAIQKRCRDLHYIGTIFILAFSPLIYILQWWHYGEANNLPIMTSLNNPFELAMVVAGILSYLYLILVPGKKDRTFTSTSPLLKYPAVYFGIWGIIYFVGFYALFGKII